MKNLLFAAIAAALAAPVQAQTLTLHRNRGALHRELKSAETALATDPTDENFQHLLDIRAQLADHEAIEALIDGFGEMSGRASGR